jgi:hypothetical protein
MHARTRFAALCALIVALAVGSGWACSHNPGAAATGDDASNDAGSEAGDDADAALDVGIARDASSSACTLGDGVTDPVALCTQQQVLRAELQYAYTKGQGVAPGWSSTGPAYAPLPGHAWQDDLGLAGALGAFTCSANVYGNAASTAAFGAAMSDLATVLLPQLQAQPSPLQGVYDGEIYFRLRWAQAGFGTVSSTTASALQALADAYGASLAAQAYPIAPFDGGSPGGTVIGTRNMDGSVTYAPAQSAMAAAALLDMALLHSGGAGADAGTVQGWASTAAQVLTYVLSRGADPATGLFYQSLVTSGDPSHDMPVAALPTSDSMLTETQAWVVLALARAQDRVDSLQAQQDGGVGDGGAPLPEAYWIAGASLAGAMNAASLFDGPVSPPMPPPPGAFMEGLVLSSSTLLRDKTTIGNAIMLGGFHRVALGAGSTLGYELGELRAALVQFSPAHSSLFTIVTDSTGNPEQQAYLRAGSQAYGYALAYPVDAGAIEPGAANYRSDAVHAMVEGLTQLWHGAPDDVRCAP